MESLMKNIINNEQMISIADLKKQAKIARKQNNQLSNHSESLKALAQEYNFASWEKLLDAAYLPLNIKKKTFSNGQSEQIDWQNNELLEKLLKITNLMKSSHEEYEFLNKSAGYNALFNFFYENLLKFHNTQSSNYQKIKLLIDFMINSFLEYKQGPKEFKNILSFATLSKENPYFKDTLSKNLSDKLRHYMKLNNLKIYGFSDYQELQISDALQIENFNDHNEIILIINSLDEKINIMATIYDVIENSKKDNTFRKSWLYEYENFISLGVYDEWSSRDVQNYQKLLRDYSSSFFDQDKHKMALNYFDYYINGHYRKITTIGTIDEIIKKIKTDPEYDIGYKLDIEKAYKSISGEKSQYIQSQRYKFIFYYIIH